MSIFYTIEEFYLEEYTTKRLLVKITDTNRSFSLEEAIPYQGAKPMYLIDTEDKEEIRNINN